MHVGLTILLLGTAGASIIITKSLIFKGFRTLFDVAYLRAAIQEGYKPYLTDRIRMLLNKLFNCPMCVGVWIGFGFLWGDKHFPEETSYIAFACAGSLCSWVVWQIAKDH